ncbi:hypothetical protein PMIN07_012038 [Paraphaeosphaeria minitans]
MEQPRGKTVHIVKSERNFVTAATPRFVLAMQSFTPATDTAVTASLGSTLQHTFLPSHIVREKASSSSTLLAVPELVSHASDYEPPITCTTPPPSPTSTRRTISNMDFDARSRNQAKTYTPPSTPTKRSHSKSSSVSSSSVREELENLRRGMPSGYSVEGTEKPGSHEPRQFPAWSSDYEFDMDAAGTQKVIGTGAWSTVYLASPAPSMLEELAISSSLASSGITPPLTPVRSRGSSMSKPYPPMPSAYAIKVPCEKTAHRVLTEEGHILSYLSRFPSAEKYLVPYYGQDMRTDALVMGYMPSTLDSLITAELNTRNGPDRAALLADVFPYIACNLLDGLVWLQDKACVHGDIKPSNILIAINPSTRTPLDYVAAGEHGLRSAVRLDALSMALGFGVKAWFARVLVRDETARRDVVGWRGDLRDALM